ncbi:MAG TPA: hypothetical protein VGJ13_03955 [Pseudonocardiaceae bacterium]
MRTVEAGPVPPSQAPGWAGRYTWGGRYEWAGTPSTLRVAQLILVLGVLLAGSVGLYAAHSLQVNTKDIKDRLEPLNTNVSTVYQSLADADARATAGFPSSTDAAAQRGADDGYDQDIANATENLTHATTQTNNDAVTEASITDITTQLTAYTGLIGQARANNQQNPAAAVNDLKRASDLMRYTILSQVVELQQQQAQRLDAAYQQAKLVKVVALGAGGVSLAGLIWAQVFLFRRTHRICNVGLAMASAAVIAGLVWWTVAGVTSSHALTSSQRHSRALSDALVPAQIAALRSRAVENLGLVATRTGGGQTGGAQPASTGSATDDDFNAQMLLLAQGDGAGGALGAARQFATDQAGKARVQAAVDAVHAYRTRHSDAAFNTLVAKLQDAVDHETGAFNDDIHRARLWITDLDVGTGALLVAAEAGVIVGIQRRLKDYR